MDKSYFIEGNTKLKKDLEALMNMQSVFQSKYKQNKLMLLMKKLNLKKY